MASAIRLDLSNMTANTAFACSVVLYTGCFFAGRWMLQARGAAPKAGEVVKDDKATRRISWLVTMAASGIMTLASLRYFTAFVASGFDVARVPRDPVVCDAVTAAFVGYLATDCVLGVIFYRRQFNLLTGWIHHISYIGLCSYLIHREWSHIFCLSVILELPTFHLALAYVFPIFRHDMVFTVLFFLTRIVFHLVLIVAYATPYGQHHSTLATSSPTVTALPSIFLSTALPLHIWWFSNSISGILRRSKSKSKAKVESSPGTTPTPAAVPPTTEVEGERAIGLWIARRLPVDANGPIMQRIRLRLRHVRRTLPERMRRLQREFQNGDAQMPGRRAAVERVVQRVPPAVPVASSTAIAAY